MHVCDGIPDNAANRACYTCGGSHDVAGPRQMIDTNVMIDYEGRLVICAVCVGVMAGLLGFATPGEHDALQLELADAQADAAGAEEKLDELVEENHALKRTIESFGAESILATLGVSE